MSAAAFKVLSKEHNGGHFVADRATTKAIEQEVLKCFYTDPTITPTGRLYKEVEVLGIPLVVFEVPGKPWQLGVARHDEGRDFWGLAPSPDPDWVSQSTLATTASSRSRHQRRVLATRQAQG
jgi:hypothetical protein